MRPMLRIERQIETDSEAWAKFIVREYQADNSSDRTVFVRGKTIWLIDEEFDDISGERADKMNAYSRATMQALNQKIEFYEPYRRLLEDVYGLSPKQ